MDDMHLQFARGGASFAAQLFNLLSAGGVKENIVFSPFSIQTCIALAFLGAKGETADEIAKGLHFVSNLAPEVSQTFQFVLDKYQKSPLLKVANKVYAMHGKHLKPGYEDAIKKHFHSEAESIDFSLSDAAAKSINAWVKAKTQGKITELVKPNHFDDQTRLVLLNAMHFKGQWMHRFKERDSNEDDFWISQNQSVKVHYMCQMEHFGFARFPELECTALDMPYKDADLSMFVMLPEKREGLKQLAEKLKTVNLVDLAAKLNNINIEVMFPKYKVEYSIELVDKLKQLGITKMFSNGAEFHNLLKSPEGIYVSKVLHKATVEVNEEGTEAAAATGAVMVPLSASPSPPQFHADHPFLYFIWNRKNIMFAGSFVNAPTT